MHFAWARTGAAAAVLACACNSSSSTSFATGGAAPKAVDQPLVQFDVSGALTAPPSTSVDVGLTVVGGDVAVLVYLDGPYDDGWLSTGTVTTAGGHGKVTLRTPSHPATFTMH